MTDNLPGIEEATQTATTEEFKRERSSTRMALFLSLGCFVIAVTLALLQNTRKPAQDLAMLFDSGAYISRHWSTTERPIAKALTNSR